MNPSPRLRRIDQVAASAAAVEQPLVLLVENGPAFSALLAARVSAEPDDGAVMLEDCAQLRIEANGDCVRRSFDRVVVLRDDRRNHWVASPDGFASLFSQPSADPYVVLELARSRAKVLRKAIRDRDFGTAFETLRSRLARLPGFFSPSPTQLRAPEN